VSYLRPIGSSPHNNKIEARNPACDRQACKRNLNACTCGDGVTRRKKQKPSATHSNLFSQDFHAAKKVFISKKCTSKTTFKSTTPQYQ
jgi:hypothetical protein